MTRKLVPHHSHWGAFYAVVEDGKVVGAIPFDFDPDPSPLIEGIADAVYSPTRVATPMVRPGVVRLSCGAWYDPAGEAEGAACAHGNANVLTRDHGTSRLSQGPSSATALVEVERCSEPPPVRAFAPVPLAAD